MVSVAAEAPFLRAILPSLPSDFATQVQTLCGATPESPAEHILDTLIRFISGAECAPGAAIDAAQWNEKQQAAAQILNGMIRRPTSETKRQREDDFEPTSQASKRQRSAVEDATEAAAPRVSPDDPLFAIHSVSATAPVRRKVDITIYRTALTITHPTTHAVEASIPLSTLTRAFLLPTRGKTKGHWTVVLLSSDIPDRGKPATPAAPLNPQVIFGIDAVAPSPLSLTAYGGTTPTSIVVPKGRPTRPSLLDFLSRLPVPLIEPTPDVFKSVCVGFTSGVSANQEGVPGVEAYRGAKAGTLWFAREGVLWGESKPCEFWALEDLIGKSEGLRVVGVSGRTCTVVLTRKSIGEEEVAEGEEDVGVETEFQMVDVREKPGIEAWVRTFRHLFGKKKVAGEVKTIGQLEEDESDEEDEDFVIDSEDELSGSSTSDTSDEEEDEEGGGSEKDAEESDEEEQLESDGEEEELKEENHPLLRPGAVPRRMQRGVIDMVVGMVEEDMLGTSNAPSDGDEGLEEDELEE
ncbi:putative histone chaperone Rttp106-like [Lyophyllum shimeji]|uniref:Histone chaperone Rttp106-like n=1 Tax=Lyophyllum shimeji TaxID=47721 RepID=A0A9P3PZV7_LYOSH|nr:putative histone chaperone Rttp106-like [Lyophyllum shimeji]